MLARCRNRRDRRYSDYGGRGITVCARWAQSFPAFFADMGPRPSPQHSIERKDNAGDYEPGNCVWATRKEQQRNTRRNRLLTYRGLTLPAVAWAERIGMNPHTLRDRLRLGWPVAKALTTPIRGRP
jgi:hypothetical protein